MYSSGSSGRKSVKQAGSQGRAHQCAGPDAKFDRGKRIRRGSYGATQVSFPWHMRKLPLPLQFGSLALVIVHVPTTMPLERVPVAVEVPLEVPVSPSGLLRVRTFPAIEVEFTVKLSPPVTAPDPAVFKVAEPVSVSSFKPVAKHSLALKKPNPVMSSGSLAPPVVLVRLNDVTKFSWLGPIVAPKAPEFRSVVLPNCRSCW